jgi:hypothetical protein
MALRATRSGVRKAEDWRLTLSMLATGTFGTLAIVGVKIMRGRVRSAQNKVRG